MSDSPVKKKVNAKKIAIITVFAVILTLIVAIAVLVWTSRDILMWNNSHPIRIAGTSLDTSGLSGFAADALYLVQTIEQVHPIFVIDGYLPENYEAIRDEFLLYAQGDITRQEFIFASWRYITALRDGHMTGLQLLSSPQETLSGDLLSLSWLVQDDNLYLQEQDGYLAKVLEIGSVSPHDVFALVDYYVYSENPVDRNRILALHSRYSGFIELAGGAISDNTTVITVEDNGEVRTITANFDFLQQRAEENDNEPEFIIRYEFIDDIFFIDFRMFVPDDGIDETIYAIERAIENGTRKFIIDLRGNGGGNSWHGQRLLHAMGITLPNFGAVRRFSDLFIDTAMLTTLERLQVRLISPFARGQIFSPSTATASNPNEVFVSVLTDRFTYSSATMMAVWVQDGGFGNIIGGISSNAPSAFGDMLRFELPYSEIGIRVSHARFLRPDANADQSALMPDILIDPAYALYVALDYLRNLGGLYVTP